MEDRGVRQLIDGRLEGRQERSGIACASGGCARVLGYSGTSPGRFAVVSLALLVNSNHYGYVEGRPSLLVDPLGLRFRIPVSRWRCEYWPTCPPDVQYSRCTKAFIVGLGKIQEFTCRCPCVCAWRGRYKGRRVPYCKRVRFETCTPGRIRGKVSLGLNGASVTIGELAPPAEPPGPFEPEMEPLEGFPWMQILRALPSIFGFAGTE